MKTKIEKHNFDLTINKSNERLNLDIIEYPSIIWDVDIEYGSYYAALDIKVKPQALMLEVEYEDDSLWDEEAFDYKDGGKGVFTLLVNIEDCEVVKNIKSTQFAPSHFSASINISEDDVERLKQGTITVEAINPIVEFEDC